MNRKKIISALLSVACAGMIMPQGVSAQDNAQPAVHTVTFLDFDGNKLTELSVKAGEKIDYSSVDTSSLHSYPDKYTEKKFYKWSMTPETTDTDITVQALYQSASIMLKKEPSKRRYTNMSGEVELEGLSVSITLVTQSPELDSSGEYKTTSSVINDVALSCEASPSSLSEAFKDGSTSAEIGIIPIGDTKPLATYTIYLVENLGDINGNGITDAVDASMLLRKYADGTINDELLFIGDINGDGKLSSVDATLILRYYAAVSADVNNDWDDIIKIK